MSSMNLEEFLEMKDEAVEEAMKESLEMVETDQYYKITDNLMRLCRILRFDNDSIYFFGSRTFGLGHDNSDLDIFIDCNEDFYADTDKKVDSARLEEIMDNLDYNWEVEVFLPYITVPLLKVYFRPLGIYCDITVSNGLSVMNCGLLDHLFDIQSEARNFFHFIRLWIEEYRSSVNFKSYQLTLLVIFFLQTKNLMPSIERVQRNLEAEYIDGWNVTFDDEKDITCYGTRKIHHYQNHLVDFFAFYRDFEYDKYVMSTYKGIPILRANHAIKGFRLDKPMCVAGPIKQSYNHTYDFGMRRLKKFVNLCKWSVDVLTE